MNINLLKGAAKSLMYFYNSKANIKQEANLKLLESKDEGHGLSFECRVVLLDALHSSAGEVERLDLSIKILLS